MNYRNTNSFEEFANFADVGLRLAYEVDKAIVPNSPEVEATIRQTFDDFLADWDLEDTGFESLEDILVSEVDDE